MSTQPAIRAWWKAAFVLWILVTAPPCVNAGLPYPVGPGSRIRVAAPLPNGTVVGYVVKLSGDTLVMRHEAGCISDGYSSRVLIPVPSIMSLELSTGFGRGVRKKMAIGFLAGAGVGAVFGAAASEESDRSQDIIGAALIGGLIGSMGGLLMGMGSPKVEHWTRIPPARPRAQLSIPSAGAFAVGVSFGF